MKQEVMDEINKRSNEQGHRLRLEEGCIDSVTDTTNTTRTREETDVLVESQLNNICKLLNGIVYHQTVLDHKGHSYKRIIIEYDILHDSVMVSL